MVPRCLFLYLNSSVMLCKILQQTTTAYDLIILDAIFLAPKALFEIQAWTKEVSRDFIHDRG